MTPAQSIRRYIDAIELANDDFISTALAIDARHPLRGTLNEGAGTTDVLMEGPIADKIKATAASLQQKYHDMSYDFLAKATMKAMDMVQRSGNADPKVTAALQKISKVGKFAVQNRALIAVLAGMVATLVGLANNPAGMAQAASNINATLGVDDVNQIIDNLAQSGIHIDPTIADAANALPPEIGMVAKKAAAALRAIEDFDFEHGMVISSDRKVDVQQFRVDGVVTKTSHIYEENIVLKTPDGKLTIAEMHTKSSTVDGVFKHEHSRGGIQFTLNKAFKGLPKDQYNAVMKLIQGGAKFAMMQKEDEGDAFGGINQMLQTKQDDFAALAASLVGDRPDGTYRVHAGPDGVRVMPVGGNRT